MFLRYNKMKKVIVLCLLAISLTCCSVKEDRSDCPCILTIDMTGNFARSFPQGFEAVPLEVSCFSSKNRDTYDVLDTRVCGPIVEELVSRGEESVTGIFIPNRGNYKVHSDELYLNAGNQADSIYAFSAKVNSASDEAYLDPVIKKQFSTIYIECQSLAEAADVEWNVIGYVGGMSLKDLSPLSGRFAYRIMSPLSPGVWSFRMPRQKQADMIMNLVDADGENRIPSIEIGRLIEQTGYDFADEDMKDVHITIDIKKSTATLIVEGWDEVFVYGLF